MQHKNNPPSAHRFALIFQQICQTGSKQVSILEDEGHDDSILVDQVKTSREINTSNSSFSAKPERYVNMDMSLLISILFF